MWGEPVPLGVNLQVVRHVLVPEEETVVAPPACCQDAVWPFNRKNEFWLEKSLEFWLEIPFTTRKMCKIG